MRTTLRISTLNRAWIGLAATVLVVSIGGCLDDVSGVRPITFALSTDDSAPTIGQTVTFSFEATGTGISQVNIDFGDGQSDQHTYFGPVEAAGFSTHEYTTAGTYVVRGELVAAAGSTTDSVTVTVN